MRRSVLPLIILIVGCLSVSTIWAVYSPITVTNALWGSQQIPLSIEPGTSNNPYTVYLQNLGVNPAVNVTATLLLSYPFTSPGGGSITSNTLTILQGSANLPTTFYLNVDRSAKKGVYQATLKLTYTVVSTSFDDKFTVNLPVTTAANLTVQSMSWGSAAAPMIVSAGTHNAQLLLTVKNTGDAMAFGVGITLHVSAPFIYEATGVNGSESVKLGAMPAGGSATAQLTLSVDPGTGMGLYPQAVTLSFNDLEINQTVYVPVAGTVSLTVQGTYWGSTAVPVTVSPGTSYATLLVNLKNTGDSPAANVTATLRLRPPFSYIAGGSEREQIARLGIILAGGVATAQFTSSVAGGVPTGMYPVEIILSSNNGAATSQTVYVPVLGAPKVVVQSYGFQGGNLFPGDTYVALTVSLINSGNSTARDVDAVLTLPPQLSASYPGSTSVTVGQIQPGAQPSTVKFYIDVPRETSTPIDLSLYLKVVNNGASKTFSIPVTISAFADFTSSSSQGPSMQQGAADVSLPLIVKNIGNETAKSVQAQLLLPNELSGNTFTYLGDMGSGASNIATFSLDVTSSASTGSYYGTIRVSWIQDNAPSRQFTQDLPISFTVTSSLTNQIVGSITPTVIAVIVVVIAALIVLRIAMTRRRR